MEKVIKGLECCSKNHCAGEECPYYGTDCDSIRADALALLKEQERKLDSIICFENGDKVRLWECPLCKSEVRIVLKGGR